MRLVHKFGHIGHDQPTLGGDGSTVDIQSATWRVIDTRTHVAHINISSSASGQLFCARQAACDIFAAWRKWLAADLRLCNGSKFNYDQP